MKPNLLPSLALLISFGPLFSAMGEPATNPPRNVVVDTGQDRFFDDRSAIRPPRPGDALYGQDAHYSGPAPAYRDNGNGTVTDLNTGLMWSQTVDSRKVSLEVAEAIARSLTLGGHQDWRVPNIKELYSLIDFRGTLGKPQSISSGVAPADAIPFINTDYFDFLYGDGEAGERFIDAQWLSSTRYVALTMERMPTIFGVNFADGRIKGYGTKGPPGRPEKLFFARYVRGTPYGNNDFVDNGDQTITDRATGLTWTQKDSGKGMTWQEALAYAENLELAGHSDWRLPNIKELQSIVDYTRSPETSDSPAIDPLFATTSITNEANQKDWPFFWSSTTHEDGPQKPAAYIAFGRAIGEMHGHVTDVHGAGAQRSDPKSGTARLGHGPQGDAQRVLNYVRAVRGGPVGTPPTTASDPTKYPQKVRVAKTSSGQNEAAASAPHAPPTSALSPHSQANQRTRSPQGSGTPQKMHPSGGPGTMPPGGGGPGAAGFISRLDKNNDGKVSRTEFDGPRNAFKTFDKNKDGYVTVDEAPTGPPPQGGPGGGSGQGRQGPPR